MRLAAPRMAGLLAGVVVAMSAVQHARADSFDESYGPRALGAGEALRAASFGSTAKNLNPAGLALSRSYAIEGTYGFRPQDDTSAASASICDSTAPQVAACVYYDYLTARPVTAAGYGTRKLHEAGLTLAVPFAGRVLLGATWKYVDYEESGSEMDAARSRDDAVIADAGAILKLAPSINLALVGYNVVGGDEGQFPRAAGGGLAVFATDALMLAADGRLNLVDRAMRFCGGAEFFLRASDGQQGFPLRAGYIHDTGEDASWVTAGVGFVTQKVGLDVGARKSLSGEDELMVQLGVRLFMPN